jgi:hypothetical protein
MSRERSTYFTWLEILIEQYEQEIGDGRGRELWNHLIDKYKPEGFEKIESEINT